jgi:hypothetical protein
MNGLFVELVVGQHVVAREEAELGFRDKSQYPAAFLTDGAIATYEIFKI